MRNYIFERGYTMKFIAVDSLPRVKGEKNKLQELIEAFMNSPYKIVKLDYEKGAYKSPAICCSTMKAAVKRSHRGIDVVKRGDDVYLVKRL
jgi:malate/lactate dehydrogenase